MFCIYLISSMGKNGLNHTKKKPLIKSIELKRWTDN